ncbi:MAG: PHP domain-containing protein, partial [Planctomycetota bacterium]
GAALLYFTGSKAHNVELRERAIKRGMRLNEYGLFPDDGEAEPPQKRGIEPIAAATEAEIYEHLDLPFIPPAIREDRGECTSEQPDLIAIDAVVAELHSHTTASDGRLSIDDLVDEARARGFHTLAITDHSKASVQAGGLSPDRLREHAAAIRAVDAERVDITVLAGSEVDILIDGELDYDNETLACLDFVVASPHASLKQPGEVATARLIRAVSHPAVHVLGHPTGRLIGRRGGLEPDMDAVIAAAVEHRVALEINASPRRLDLRDTHVRAAVDAGALIAINTDAHGTGDFDNLRYGVLTGRRGWLSPEQCVNCWDRERLLEWIRSKRADA